MKLLSLNQWVPGHSLMGATRVGLTGLAVVVVGSVVLALGTLLRVSPAARRVFVHAELVVGRFLV